MDKSVIESALRNVKYPGFSRDIVSFGLIRDITIDTAGVASISLSVTTGDANIPQKLKNDIERALEEIDGITDIEVSIAVTLPKTAVKTSEGQRPQKPNTLGKVKYIMAIASGKGGVGKSTFAVNLSCAFEKILAAKGMKSQVGLMDCDIYGPSTPLMIGIQKYPEIENNLIIPPQNFGVRVISMGLLIDEDAPVVWRGPMIMKTIQQFASDVNWGELEVLVVDLPPGTGDAQLSLVQVLPLDGAVIVTTPQKAAVDVTRRGARMFEKVNVPILGVAENMSYMEDPQTKAKSYLFGKDGGRFTALDLDTDFLGQVPFDTKVREGGDKGIPIVIGDPESSAAKAFFEIANQLYKKLADSKVILT